MRAGSTTSRFIGASNRSNWLVAAIPTCRLLENRPQRIDHAVELRFRYVMTGVNFLHGVAAVTTGAAGEIAELLGEQSLDAAQVRVLEAATQAGIRRRRGR
jgi:hypothetical protein